MSVRSSLATMCPSNMSMCQSNSYSNLRASRVKGRACSRASPGNAFGKVGSSFQTLRLGRIDFDRLFVIKLSCDLDIHIIMLSSSGDLDRHIIMLSSCYHAVSSTCASSRYPSGWFDRHIIMLHGWHTRPLTRLACTPFNTAGTHTL
jgi:hypothetical protein